MDYLIKIAPFLRSFFDFCFGPFSEIKRDLPIQLRTPYRRARIVLIALGLTVGFILAFIWTHFEYGAKLATLQSKLSKICLQSPSYCELQEATVPSFNLTAGQHKFLGEDVRVALLALEFDERSAQRLVELEIQLLSESKSDPRTVPLRSRLRVSESIDIPKRAQRIFLNRIDPDSESAEFRLVTVR